MAALLPLLPLVALTLAAPSRRRLPAILAGFPAAVFLGAGALGALMLSAVSGGGGEMVLLHATALTLACATSFLLVSDIRQKVQRFAFGVFMLPVLVGIWSLTAWGWPMQMRRPYLPGALLAVARTAPWAKS